MPVQAAVSYDSSGGDVDDHHSPVELEDVERVKVLAVGVAAHVEVLGALRVCDADEGGQRREDALLEPDEQLLDVLPAAS